MQNHRENRLFRFALQSAARDLLPERRVAWCLRRLGVDPKSKSKQVYRSVHVCYSPSIERAHYKHLIVCGELWNCPLCASKISERRRVELQQAIDHNQDLEVALASYTLQHDGSHSLKENLDSLLRARRMMQQQRRFQEFKQDCKWVGSIRSLEVTYGASGWHPHCHELPFFESGVDLEECADFLKESWLYELERVGRSASWYNGVDVRTAKRDVGSYVAKWGRQPLDLRRPFKWSMEHELTKQVSKVSRSDKGRSPMQLLSDFLGGDGKAGELFKEYSKCFKGKKQLVWSRGLRGRLGLGPAASDQELAEREEQDAILLGELTLTQWRVILGNDARGELLEAASSGDVNDLAEFLRRFGLVLCDG